jgi:methylase of polypeptide subunit release factors
MSSIEVPARSYLNLKRTTRIKESLSIVLSRHSYLPRIDDLQSDWVAHVAVPAFKLFRSQRGDSPIESFCSIGTGSGLDVIAAIEILGAWRIGLTDVHEDVVATAVDNITRNHSSPRPLAIEAGYGDLFSPLRPYNARYDLIYENLPNVPLPDASESLYDRKSSTHLAPRTEEIPALVKSQMLDLHYLALLQARDFMLQGSAMLSIIGGRVPLGALQSLGTLAGYSSSSLAYTWKVQADPEEIIRDHAQKQREGFGPFYFYRADALQKTFSSVDFSRSGKDAIEIERSLLNERLDAINAYEVLKQGEKIGHTVAVLKSELR